MLRLMGGAWSAGMARCSAQRSDPRAKELHTRALARGAARVSLRVLAKNTAAGAFIAVLARTAHTAAAFRHSLPPTAVVRPALRTARIPSSRAPLPKRPPNPTHSAPNAHPQTLIPVKQSFAYQRCEDAADAADAHPARDLRVLVPAGRTAGGGQDGGPARRASAGCAGVCGARRAWRGGRQLRNVTRLLSEREATHVSCVIAPPAALMLWGL